MESIEDMIRGYIVENILYGGDGFPYGDEASFLDLGIIDSMNVMEMVMFVEDRFGIQVKDEEITPDHFDSVHALAEFVRNAHKVSA